MPPKAQNDPKAEDSQIAHAAPLDPPADSPAGPDLAADPEPQPGADEDGFGGDAPEPEGGHPDVVTIGAEPDAEPDTDGDPEPEQEPDVADDAAKSDATAGVQAELEAAKVEHDAAQDTAPSEDETVDEFPTPAVNVAPATATLDAPPEPEEEDKEEESPSLADAAAESLADAKQATVVGERGELLDPDTLFGPVETDGKRRARVTMLQRHKIPPYDRITQTLLLARGQKVTDANAQLISAKVQAERA